MMGYKLAFVLFMGAFISCSQSKKLNYNSKGKMEKFELDRFKKLKSQGRMQDTAINGTVISFMEAADLYQEK